MTCARAWAMPSAATFELRPVAELLARWLAGRAVVVDPFARNSRRGTHRNDIDPGTAAESHMDAASFMLRLHREGMVADAVLLDPPYSPRQISEHYRVAGLKPTTATTQNGALYKRARIAADRLLRPGGVVVSCGWNSTGMGRQFPYEVRELLLVNHGGAHNDTIIVVEEKLDGDANDSARTLRDGKSVLSGGLSPESADALAPTSVASAATAAPKEVSIPLRAGGKEEA